MPKRSIQANYMNEEKDPNMALIKNLTFSEK